MLHGVLFICFAMGLPHAAAQVEEEAVQSGDLWPPLLSQDGHAVTRALALT